jgi:transposase
MVSRLNKSSRKELSESTVNTIWQFHLYGVSGAAIGRHLSVPKSTVHYNIRRLRKQPQHVYTKALRTGRPPKLDERAKRHLVRWAALNPFATLETIATPSKTHCRIHTSTARRYLQKNEYYAFRPRRKPYLSKIHKEKRLRFARIHQFNREEDVACYAFCDEATFKVSLDTTPPYVRRKRGNAYESRYLKPTFKSGRTTVSVFGVISLDFKSELFINKAGERNNASKYCWILHDVSVPFYQQLYEHRGQALWTQDGAPIHRAKRTQTYMDESGIISMDWPPQSPDFNPIENLWRIMKLRISKRREYITSREQMVNVLQEEWAKITPSNYRTCIMSWSKRMKECIKNKGEFTHY